VLERYTRKKYNVLRWRGGAVRYRRNAEVLSATDACDSEKTGNSNARGGGNAMRGIRTEEVGRDKGVTGEQATVGAVQ